MNMGKGQITSVGQLGMFGVGGTGIGSAAGHMGRYRHGFGGGI